MVEVPDLTSSLSPGGRSAVMVILSAAPRSSSSSGSAHHNGLRLFPEGKQSILERNPFVGTSKLKCLSANLFADGMPVHFGKVFPAGQPGRSAAAQASLRRVPQREVEQKARLNPGLRWMLRI